MTKAGKEVASRNDTADKKRPTPGKLYKYRSLVDELSRQRLRRILVDNRLYFPSRLEFNDPLDCLFPKFVQGRAMDRFLSRRLKEVMKGSTRVQRRLQRRSIDLPQLRRCIQKQVDQAGILSLSELPDHPLMWAYYADSYRGVCLEFEVVEFVTYPQDPRGFFGPAQPVIYADKRPIVFDPDASDEENVERALLTKSEDWSHEKEFRIINHEGGRGECSFKKELLTGIIFGYRTPEADREQIRQWAAQAGLKVKFYVAQPNEEAGEIEIVSA